MTLPEQIQEFPLIKGINEKMHPFVLDPDAFAEVINGYYRQTGAIAKRNGFELVSRSGVTGGTNRASCLKMLEFEGELCVVDDVRGTLHAVVKETDAAFAGSIEKDQVPEGTLDRYVVSSRMLDCVTNADVAVAYDIEGNAYEVYAVQYGSGATSGRIHAYIRSRLTGEIVFDEDLIGTSGSLDNEKPKCVSVGGRYVFVVWYNDGEILARRIDMQSNLFAFNTATTAVIDADTGSQDAFDVCEAADGAGWYLMYFTEAGTPDADQIRINEYDTSASISGTVNTVLINTVVHVGCGMAITALGADVWAAWVGTDDSDPVVRASRLTTGLSNTTGVIDVSTLPATFGANRVPRIGIAPYATTPPQCHIVWEQYNTSGLVDTDPPWTGGYDASAGNNTGTAPLVASKEMQQDGTLVSSVDFYTFRIGLESKPFMYQNRTYAVCHFRDHDKSDALDDGEGSIQASFSQYQFYLVELKRQTNGIVVSESVIPEEARPVMMFAQSHATSTGDAIPRHIQVLSRVTSTSAAYGNIGSCPTVDANAQPSVYGSTANVWPGIVVREYALEAATAGGRIAALDGFQFNMRERGAYDSAHLGLSQTFAMGLCSQYDGSEIFENNFCWYPWFLTMEQNQSDSLGQLGEGVYTYLCAYKAWDNKGQLIWSRVSDPTSINTSIVSDGVSVHGKIPWLHLTCREEVREDTTGRVFRITVHIYRSRVDQGAPYYEITNPITLAANANSSSFNQIIRNIKGPTIPTTPDTLYLTFEDRLSDVDLLGRPTIYTNGGVLENFQPPPSRYCVSHKNRIWIAGCEDARDIYFTKEFLRGECPAFTPTNSIRIEDGGGITGIISLDDYLVVFKRDRIYKILGDGPNDTGFGSQLTLPVLVNSEVGCIDGHSIVFTKDGVMFPSSRGIYLLDRALGTHYISAPIEATYEAYKPLRNAVLYDRLNLVVFGLEDSRDVSEGEAYGQFVVYDLHHRAWTRWETQIGVPECAIVHNDRYWWATSSILGASGNILKEADSNSDEPYSDAQLFYVPMRVTTPWYRPAGLQGQARCWWMRVLTEYKDVHSLAVSVAYDYDETNESFVGLWFDANLTALARTPIQPLEVRLPQQRCESIQFTIEDTFGSLGGSPPRTQGYELVGIRMGYGIAKRGRGVLEDGARQGFSL